jgi:predicted AlkP superfamily phosphohydrolase/phosphomutase
VLLSAVLLVFSAAAPARTNDPALIDTPYVVLISLDGFRWDFPDRVETPALARLEREGARAAALQPVFPTLTFPNHFSIATGVPPWRHGIVANTFPDETRQRWYHYKDPGSVGDGSWYRAEPVWVTAEKQGLVAAAYFFVGTEAPVFGVRPTYWRPFRPGVSGQARVRQAMHWLSMPPEKRPHLVTLYYEQADDHTHWSGVGSPESDAAIREVDGYVGALLDGIEELPYGDRVYVIVVSDHGQSNYRKGVAPLILDEIVDMSGTRVTEGGPYVFVYLDTGDATRAAGMRDAINAVWDCGRALLPQEAPDAWEVHEDPRYPDLIVQADPGCGVLSTRSARSKMTPGDHGWPPEDADMRGIFYVRGPGIHPGLRLPVLRVTDVAPLVRTLLGLKSPQDDDDRGRRLLRALQAQPN